MTNFKEKKCIIFDLGNVVIDIDLNITYQRLKALGFTDIKDFFNRNKQSGIFGDLEEGKITPNAFVEELKKQLNNNVTYNDIVNAWNALMLDYKPERIKAILELKKKYKVYVLSNTNALHIKNCANRVPIVGSLTNLFDKVYYSHELGMSKPNENIFCAVLKDIPFKPEEVLFLDDTLANIKAAEKLGIESWLVEYPDQWISKFDIELSQV